MWCSQRARLTWRIDVVLRRRRDNWTATCTKHGCAAACRCMMVGLLCLLVEEAGVEAAVEAAVEAVVEAVVEAAAAAAVRAAIRSQ